MYTYFIRNGNDNNIISLIRLIVMIFMFKRVCTTYVNVFRPCFRHVVRSVTRRDQIATKGDELEKIAWGWF